MIASEVEKHRLKHVRVTLSNGRVCEGRLRRSWSYYYCEGNKHSVCFSPGVIETIERIYDYENN